MPRENETRAEYTARFRAAVELDMQRSGNNPESMAITLRHFVHPFGYDLAFEFMSICAELAHEPLDERGVWVRGAQGELWLREALARKGKG